MKCVRAIDHWRRGLGACCEGAQTPVQVQVYVHRCGEAVCVLVAGLDLKLTVYLSHHIRFLPHVDQQYVQASYYLDWCSYPTRTNNNIPPGLLVEDDVVSRVYDNFYLVSQAGILGSTCQPRLVGHAAYRAFSFASFTLRRSQAGSGHYRTHVRVLHAILPQSCL